MASDEPRIGSAASVFELDAIEPASALRDERHRGSGAYNHAALSHRGRRSTLAELRLTARFRRTD
jgi:hypothetical protein